VLIFRQLFDLKSSTYSYLLGDSASNTAILIDPVLEQVQRDSALIRELGLSLLYTIETHVHADHITGAWLLKQQFNSQIIYSKAAAVETADVHVTQDDRINFGQRHVTIHSTPGHTSGCITIVLDDQTQAFTGDCLLIRGAGRTDFQDGDALTMYKSIQTSIFSLPEQCLLWPSHDYQGRTVTSVGEEKQFNPRLGGQVNETDFIGYMNNLNLPHPKQIDQALPANMMCGKLEHMSVKSSDSDWAPLRHTYAGVREIDAYQLEERVDTVQIIDVRKQDEYIGILGHIKNSKLIPLDDLTSKLELLSKEIPIVTVCRSGARSTQAAVLLKREGFDNVANLAGGMIQWNANQLPIVSKN
jgi:sulfur dioxygenase